MQTDQNTRTLLFWSHPPFTPDLGSPEGVSQQPPPRFCALLANSRSRPGGFRVKILRFEVSQPKHDAFTMSPLDPGTGWGHPFDRCVSAN